MAQVFNLLATMGGPTPVGFVLLVVVLLIGHVLNIAINLLGSFVHTSRLQYLEFFGKFFEDGGAGFVPAEPSNEYSTVEADTPETSETLESAETR
jgi:V/A-type H+-transporting ATPase subunit I